MKSQLATRKSFVNSLFKTDTRQDSRWRECHIAKGSTVDAGLVEMYEETGKQVIILEEG